MYESDREYFSRFSLDPAMEYSLEDLYGSEFSCEEEINPLADENIHDPEDLIPEDDFLFDD